MENLPDTPIYEESTPNFIFDAIINKDGIIDISELKFNHPQDKIPSCEWSDKNFDLRIIDEKNPNYWYETNNSKRTPKCGEFYIHLRVWYRKSEWIDISDYKALTDYLDDYGGVAIYRDGILVLDSKLSSEHDWLGLAKKHIKQGFRISYRDFIGNVEITQGENFNLIDKTNREGLIENQASKDLSKLIANAIEKIPSTSIALLIGNALPPKFSFYQSINIYNHIQEHIG